MILQFNSDRNKSDYSLKNVLTSKMTEAANTLSSKRPRGGQKSKHDKLSKSGPSAYYNSVGQGVPSVSQPSKLE